MCLLPTGIALIIPEIQGYIVGSADLPLDISGLVISCLLVFLTVTSNTGKHSIVMSTKSRGFLA